MRKITLDEFKNYTFLSSLVRKNTNQYNTAQILG